MTKSILVIGIGRFGRHISRKLEELNQDVLAVDKDENKINEVLSIVTNAQIGDSTNEDFLRSLGISNFDVCIVAIGDDFQTSLETTFLLKELGAKKVISRATMDVQAKFLKRNGADFVVYPEKQVAEWAGVRFSSDHIFDYIMLDKKYSIFEVSIPPKWIGRKIGELDVRKRFHINILAMRTKGEMDIDIGAETILTKESTLMVLGKTKEIQKCFHI